MSYHVPSPPQNDHALLAPFGAKVPFSPLSMSKSNAGLQSMTGPSSLSSQPWVSQNGNDPLCLRRRRAAAASAFDLVDVVQHPLPLLRERRANSVPVPSLDVHSAMPSRFRTLQQLELVATRAARQAESLSFDVEQQLCDLLDADAFSDDDDDDDDALVAHVAGFDDLNDDRCMTMPSAGLGM